jgi:hypothetical protein
MVDEIINLNPQAEGSNAAANRNRNAVIRTEELAVERELENLKNKVAEKGNNESFLEFDQVNKRLKENYKNRSLKIDDIKAVKGEISIRDDLLFFEMLGDIIGNATIPLYGA